MITLSNDDVEALVVLLKGSKMILCSFTNVPLSKKKRKELDDSILCLEKYIGILSGGNNDENL